MASINTGKVALGGLAAGLIISMSEYVLYEFVVADSQAALFDSMGLAPPGGSAIGLFVAISLALGITTVWMYAMLRAHSGPGPKTAVCAAILAWFLFYALPGFQSVVLGMLPGGMAVWLLGWAFVEMLVATTVGAKLYTD